MIEQTFCIHVFMYFVCASAAIVLAIIYCNIDTTRVRHQ